MIQSSTENEIDKKQSIKKSGDSKIQSGMRNESSELEVLKDHKSNGMDGAKYWALEWIMNPGAVGFEETE